MTSGPRLVIPQAMRWVWPMITPGTPANVKPAMSNGQAAESDRQCRPIWYQMPGRLGARCGSLASSGLPVAVSAPETTHEFDPTPSSPPPASRGTASTAACAESRLPCAAAESSAASTSPEPAPAAVVAAGRRRGRRGRCRGDGARVGDDRGVTGGGVRGPELIDAGDVLDAPVDPRPAELVVVVAPQVPGHGLEPGDRVQRRPGLDVRQRVREPQHAVVETELGGRAVADVVVDPAGVVVEVAAGRRGPPGRARPAPRAASPACAPPCPPAARRRSARPAPRAAPPSRAGGSPSGRTGPAPARTPARGTGRRRCSRRPGAPRGRRGARSPGRPGRAARASRPGWGRAAGRRRPSPRTRRGPRRRPGRPPPAGSGAGHGVGARGAL